MGSQTPQTSKNSNSSKLEKKISPNSNSNISNSLNSMFEPVNQQFSFHDVSKLLKKLLRALKLLLTIYGYVLFFIFKDLSGQC